MKRANGTQGEFDFAAVPATQRAPEPQQQKPGVQQPARAGDAARVRLAATDLSNHLACRHVTTLDLGVLRGEREEPEWAAPDLKVIQELGLRHEAAYLKSLDDEKGSLVDLRNLHEQRAVDETLAAMKRGVAAIAQGSLARGRWFGRPDVMRRVNGKSRFGDWSYEVYDCKLARETKAATILQLALYSDLLAEVQGAAPEMMYVVVPGRKFVPEKYRFADYAAYYRHVKARLERASDAEKAEETYPEPCAHCDVCRWFKECDGRRRADDHLSLVAGIRRLQRKQLVAWQTDTMAKLAAMPLPIQERPAHGSRESYERVREQARMQVEGRERGELVHETLALAEDMGFARLPEPSAGDAFVDLEGDPFAGEHGQEYLFGFVARAGDGASSGEWSYKKRWAFNAEEEKRGFEWLVDEMMRRWAADPRMHVYHFGAYEPSAFKRLMGIYTTREDEIDRMLRAHLLVDLHTIFKQAVRASVEEYSLKKLEAFYGFERRTALDVSRAAMRYVEHRLELGWEGFGDGGELEGEMRGALEGYNEEDCRSAVGLREWLEGERKKLVDGGVAIARPEVREGAPPEELDERQKRVAELVAKLAADVPAEAAKRTQEQQARWMLAQLLDWHRRENKSGYWEGYRLAELDDDDLLEDRAGLAGLQFIGQVEAKGRTPVHRYRFEEQETSLRVNGQVYRRQVGRVVEPERDVDDEESGGEPVGQHVGTMMAINLANRTVDIKKTQLMANVHPSAVFVWDRPRKTDVIADALLRIGEWVAANGVDAQGAYRAGRDLLLRRAPRLRGRKAVAANPLEEIVVAASRIGSALDESAFAIQGPPGAGKTFTGARMICKLVAEGKKVGVTALSHKVIRKLLEEVIDAADADKIPGVRCLQKLSKGDEVERDDRIAVTKKNDEALEAFRTGAANVLGGTSFMWAREDFRLAADTLFIDEAGQLALADVVSVSQAARNLVLIGDPQQLERPLKGSHPPGAEKSALEHLLGKHKTIPSDIGMLLPETWRMHPKICDFTSELFYEGRLGTRSHTENRVLAGHPNFGGAGLWFVPVTHEGNTNSSVEEVDAVERIVQSLMSAGVEWFYGIGNKAPLKREKDILVVAPYNAQVGDLQARLPGVQVGTVDKFQGQEAAVVIYSMTTSSPEDAPRGMEFLYSLNRLNVATSRAMTNVILVGSPRLFEPECRNPRQMPLANALCRYLEMATTVRM